MTYVSKSGKAVLKAAAFLDDARDHIVAADEILACFDIKKAKRRPVTKALSAIETAIEALDAA
jgi:peptidyl-tRNA hydrolase|tara:strand:+ start:1081 stop:1269 length:189 start_codon:yes stop_codon:yes gene_type:complete